MIPNRYFIKEPVSKQVRHKWAVIIGCCSLLIAACSGTKSSSKVSSTVTSTTSVAGGFVAQPIVWKMCVDSNTPGVTCGNLEVPFDYSNPDLGSFVIFIKRHVATDSSLRIGSLLVNPGGPGFGGSTMADNASGYFSPDLLARFDVIAWDPRGTGEYTPSVNCIDQYDSYFGLDSPPDTPEEKQALIDAGVDFSVQCGKNSGTILPYISTRAAAMDMNSIRQALGEEKITYFGFSYGSVLGATWATLYPDTVRAAVLDGASDPNATALEHGLAQATGFEGQLNAFLDDCAKRSSCAFYNDGTPGAALDALLEAIDAEPLVVVSGRTPVTQGVAFTAIAQAMYSNLLWPTLEDALSAAQSGDGSGLLSLYDQYYQRNLDGSYGNELEAFLAISCLDDPGVTAVDVVDANAKIFIDAAPRLGGNFGYGYMCTDWPVKPDLEVKVTGIGAGPIVVVGTTGDPATPLKSARNMALSLEQGILVVVEADQHTGYGVNACIVAAVDEYLINLAIPVNETLCKS